MRSCLLVLSLCTVACFGLDTEFSNEQAGVKFKVIGLDTDSPKIRIENAGRETLAIHSPFSLSVAFYAEGTRVREKKEQGGIAVSEIIAVSEKLITFLPPKANIELPVDEFYFNIRDEGYGNWYSWTRGLKLLPPGKYKARFYSNSKGMTALDISFTSFRKNFDIPELVVTAPQENIDAKSQSAKAEKDTSSGELPMGKLGFKVGKYLTIEGVRENNLLTSGTQTLSVDTLNGEKLKEQVPIWIDNIIALPDKTRCVLRGYESVRMIGVPEEVLKDENRPAPQAGWQIQHYFVVTGVVEPKTLELKEK